jgi:hypothetical protein
VDIMSKAPRLIGPRSAGVIAIIAIIVVIIVLGVVLSGHGKAGTRPPSTTLVTTVTRAPSTTVTTRANGATSTTAPPSAILPAQSAFPAYQHLPYDANGVQIGLASVAANGKYVLEVFSQTLTLAQEKAVYHAFMQSYNDPGTKYQPVFSSLLSK